MEKKTLGSSRNLGAIVRPVNLAIVYELVQKHKTAKFVSHECRMQ